MGRLAAWTLSLAAPSSHRVLAWATLAVQDTIRPYASWLRLPPAGGADVIACTVGQRSSNASKPSSLMLRAVDRQEVARPAREAGFSSPRIACVTVLDRKISLPAARRRFAPITAPRKNPAEQPIDGPTGYALRWTVTTRAGAYIHAEIVHHPPALAAVVPVLHFVDCPTLGCRSWMEPIGFSSFSARFVNSTDNVDRKISHPINRSHGLKCEPRP